MFSGWRLADKFGSREPKGGRSSSPTATFVCLLLLWVLEHQLAMSIKLQQWLYSGEMSDCCSASSVKSNMNPMSWDLQVAQTLSLVRTHFGLSPSTEMWLFSFNNLAGSIMVFSDPIVLVQWKANQIRRKIQERKRQSFPPSVSLVIIWVLLPLPHSHLSLLMHCERVPVVLSPAVANSDVSVDVAAIRMHSDSFPWFVSQTD